MKSFAIRTLSVAVLQIATTLAAPAVMAADMESPKESTPAVAPAKPPAPELITLDFKGGKFSDLINAIEKATGRLPNVIVSSTAKEIDLPAFRVQQISIDDLFSSFQATQLAYMTKQGKLWCVGSRIENMDVAPISLAPYLDSYSERDIIAAIQAALDLTQSSTENRATLRFHKETKLLLICGTNRQLSTAHQVVKSLKLPAPTKAP